VVKQFLSLIFILNLLNARSGNIDSLLALSQKLNDDTQRVSLFYANGFASRFSDPGFSYQCAKKAARFAEASAAPLYIAKAFNLLGILAYRKNEFSSALAYHKKALQLRLAVNDRKGMAMSQLNLGNIYADMQQHALAETAYLEAYKINAGLGEKKAAGNCLLNLGVLNAEKRNNEAAKDYFEEALSNARTRYDYELEALCLNNLSVININLEKFDEAIANCINSIKTKDLMDNEMEKADSYLNLALAYLKKREPQNALVNLNTADSIINVFGYLMAKINACKIRAEYDVAIGNYEQAYHWLQQHQRLSDSLRKANPPVFTNDGPPEPEIKTAGFIFPYFYLNLLIVVTLAGAVILFKHRR
jgi:tetratricopeptide (TPR) repeat protein